MPRSQEYLAVSADISRMILSRDGVATDLERDACCGRGLKCYSDGHTCENDAF
jgi:hypothetical protein